MLSTSETQCLIDDIDARQDEVLAQLDELNQRIESLLNEVRPPASEPEMVESTLAESAAFLSQVNLADPADPISQLPAAA